MTTCSTQHHSRLFIGEASFRGVSALLAKHSKTHPNLGESIIATELDTFMRTSKNCPKCDSIEREELELSAAITNLFLESNKHIDYSNEPLSHTSFCSDRCQRIQKLKNRGVTVILGFDGTRIHKSKHRKIAGQRFERIHWNCPHDKSNFKNQTLPPLLSNFFKSAAYMQESGDRIHVTLAQPLGKAEFYQGFVYNIRVAAKESGYFLYAKRPFGPDRYPGYKHEMTGQEASAAGANRLREFVFIKNSWPGEARARSKISSNIFYRTTRQYYIRPTDDESSKYSVSEENTSSPETDDKS